MSRMGPFHGMKRPSVPWESHSLRRPSPAQSVAFPRSPWHGTAGHRTHTGRRVGGCPCSRPHCSACSPAAFLLTRPAAPPGTGCWASPRQLTEICSSCRLSASCCRDQSCGSPAPLSKLSNAEGLLSTYSNWQPSERVTDADTQWKWGLDKPAWLRTDKLLLILIACKIHRGRGHPCVPGMEGWVSSWGWRQSPELI